MIFGGKIEKKARGTPSFFPQFLAQFEFQVITTEMNRGILKVIKNVVG